MLPANPFGVMYCSAFSLIRSLPMRSSGNPSFHCGSPCLRYDTATDALRLSSPSICHSNPSDSTVGGSVTNSPTVVRSAAASGVVQSSDSRSSANRRIAWPLARCHRLGDCRTKRGILRCHLAGEDRADAALLVDHVLREVPGRKIAGLPEQRINRRLPAALLRDHLLEHRKSHVVRQLAEGRDVLGRPRLLAA